MTVSMIVALATLLVPLLLLLVSKRPDVPMWLHAPIDDDASSSHVSHEKSGSFASDGMSGSEGEPAKGDDGD